MFMSRAMSGPDKLRRGGGGGISWTAPQQFLFNMKTSIYFSESQSPDSTITGNDTDLGIFKHGSMKLSDPSDIGVDR